MTLFLGRAVGEPFDGSGDGAVRDPVRDSPLAKHANDPRIIELVARYQKGTHPSKRFVLPKPEKEEEGELGCIQPDQREGKQ